MTTQLKVFLIGSLFLLTLMASMVMYARPGDGGCETYQNGIGDAEIDCD